MTGKRKTSWNSKRNFKKGKFTDGGASKLEVGMVGILVSHDRNREKSCRLDTFRLLNHFADKIYGPETMEEKKEQEDDDECSDIESALSAEVTNIKGQTGGKSHQHRRFSTVKSGCNNLIFVRFREIGPGVLMRNIVQSLFSHQDSEGMQIPLVKNVLRVHPVEFTCPAYLDNMCKNIPPFVEKKLSELQETDTKEYTIDYKCRNNSHLSRQTVLDGLVGDMKDSFSGWKYNCRTQSVSVIIDVLKTVCLVSVVKDYLKYKKYNIRELIQKSGSQVRVDELECNDKTQGRMTTKTSQKEEVPVTPVDVGVTDVKDNESESQKSSETPESSTTDKQRGGTGALKPVDQDHNLKTMEENEQTEDQSNVS